jgi:hypothetical protein
VRNATPPTITRARTPASASGAGTRRTTEDTEDTCAATGAIERSKKHATLVKIFRVIAKVPVLVNDTADLYPISVRPRYIRRPK